MKIKKSVCSMVGMFVLAGNLTAAEIGRDGEWHSASRINANGEWETPRSIGPNGEWTESGDAKALQQLRKASGQARVVVPDVGTPQCSEAPASNAEAKGYDGKKAVKAFMDTIAGKTYAGTLVNSKGELAQVETLRFDDCGKTMCNINVSVRLHPQVGCGGSITVHNYRLLGMSCVTAHAPELKTFSYGELTATEPVGRALVFKSQKHRTVLLIDGFGAFGLRVETTGKKSKVLLKGTLKPS